MDQGVEADCCSRVKKPPDRWWLFYLLQRQAECWDALDWTWAQIEPWSPVTWQESLIEARYPSRTMIWLLGLYRKWEVNRSMGVKQMYLLTRVRMNFASWASCHSLRRSDSEKAGEMERWMTWKTAERVFWHPQFCHDSVRNGWDDYQYGDPVRFRSRNLLYIQNFAIMTSRS